MNNSGEAGFAAMEAALIASGSLTREQIDIGKATAPIDPIAAHDAQMQREKTYRAEGAPRAMAQAMVDAGHWTQEKADAMVAADTQEGDAAPIALQAPVPDELLQGISALDPMLDRPADPAAYDFTGADGRFSIGYLTEVRQVVHAAHLPAGTARMVLEEVQRMAKAPPDESARDLMAAQTLADAERWWPGRSKEMIGHAQRLIDQLSGRFPGIKRDLASSGAGASPVVVRLLAEHAARLYAR
jgi:hypothetical protein